MFNLGKKGDINYFLTHNFLFTSSCRLYVFSSKHKGSIKGIEYRIAHLEFVLGADISTCHMR